MTFLERIRRRRALTAEAKELLSEAVADGMIDTDAIEEVNQELGEGVRAWHRTAGVGAADTDTTSLYKADQK